jgi:hypothetical protein
MDSLLIISIHGMFSTILQESNNLRKQVLTLNHFLIAGKESIYTDIILFLTKSKKLFPLTLK